MATTIQVVENLRVGKFIDIEGKRCEVEAISFSQAITNGQATEELMNVMAQELIERDVIKLGDNGQYYFCEDSRPLLEEEEYED